MELSTLEPWVGNARKEEFEKNLQAKLIDGQWQIYRKYRPNQEGALPNTWWDDAKYSATESGTRIIKDLFGERELFSYPKSVYLVEDSLRASNCYESAYVFDYFGGSGTTPHAVSISIALMMVNANIFSLRWASISIQ